MPENLIEYIRTNLDKGTPRAVIEQTLVNSGWTKEQIEAAFSQVTNMSPINTFPSQNTEGTIIEEKPISKRSPFAIIILILVILIFSFTAYYWFFVLNSDKLTEKQVSLEGKKYSLLIPKNMAYKVVDKSQIPQGISLATFYNKNSNISLIGIGSPVTTNLDSVTCSQLKQEKVLSVKVDYFNQNYEVCKSNTDQAGVDYLDLLAIDNGYNYFVEMYVKDTYLNTSEGSARVKQIFGSFKALN